MRGDDDDVCDDGDYDVDDDDDDAVVEVQLGFGPNGQ